jgi:hypothetical protein
MSGPWDDDEVTEKISVPEQLGEGSHEKPAQTARGQPVRAHEALIARLERALCDIESEAR